MEPRVRRPIKGWLWTARIVLVALLIGFASNVTRNSLYAIGVGISAFLLLLLWRIRAISETLPSLKRRVQESVEEELEAAAASADANDAGTHCRDAEEEQLDIKRMVLQASAAPREFSFKELQEATEGFSKKLGRGGFGTVYEGTLADGTKVAVKRLIMSGHEENEEEVINRDMDKQVKKRRSAIRDKQFCGEVTTIGSARHLNLVVLLGFCVEERLLVYEFMAGGSLDRWLFHRCDSNDVSKKRRLGWKRRMQVVVETARGLAYLHEESGAKRILHLDVKPENVLLDAQLRAKLADFGLARAVGRSSSEQLVLTTLRGTPGYLAPEWLRGLGVDTKADVYGFGVLALEVASGRRVLDQSYPTDSDHFYLPYLAFRMYRDGCLLQIVDPLLLDGLSDDNRVDDEVDSESSWTAMAKMTREEALQRLIKVALWCIQELPCQRPSMSKAVHMLEGLAPVPDLPPAPATYWSPLSVSAFSTLTRTDAG